MWRTRGEEPVGAKPGRGLVLSMVLIWGGGGWRLIIGPQSELSEIRLVLGSNAITAHLGIVFTHPHTVTGQPF